MVGDKADAVSLAGESVAELVADIFRAVGVPDEGAATVAQALVDSDLEGVHSHGVMLVPMYVDRIRCGSVSVATDATTVVDQDTVVVLDAGHALGQLTGDRAMGLAVERAKQYGLGLVAVRHAFHFGTARRYALVAAQRGCVGIAMCNTRPLMPAPGGAEAVVGNNPMAIALPTSEAPLVLDVAFSEVAMGKIRMALQTGEPIPATWATDENGVPTTDPAAAIGGMLVPAAGHKGFGFAFLVDLLCGALSGGGWGDNVQPLYGDPSLPYDCSHLFIAVDVARARPLLEFEQDVARARERIRSSRRMPGVDRLFAPGGREWDRRLRNEGQVQLDRAVLTALYEVAADVGVDIGNRLSAQAQ